LCFDGLTKTIEVGRSGDVSLNASDVAADRVLRPRQALSNGGPVMETEALFDNAHISESTNNAFQIFGVLIQWVGWVRVTTRS
jgi:hypothetical protein